jgi:hypothetical protein
MTFTNKQVKLFRKVLYEFYDEYKLASGSLLDFKIKIDANVLEKFFSEIKNHLDKFINRHISLINEITLFSDINTSKVNINWDYIQQLYLICGGTIEVQEIVKKPITKESNAFNSLVGDLAVNVAKSLEGQDLTKINPAELMQSLMSGNMNVGGIDFSEIIKMSTENVKNKVSSGELDIEELRESASNVWGGIGMNMPK